MQKGEKQLRIGKHNLCNKIPYIFCKELLNLIQLIRAKTATTTKTKKTKTNGVKNKI